MIMTNLINSCEPCNLTFKMGANYVQHFKMVHDKLPPEYENAELFICDECGKTFTTKPGLQGHVDKKHRVQKTFDCDKCDQKFKQKKGFVFHYKLDHGSVPHGFKDVKIIQCDQCPKMFWQKAALEDHFKTNHTDSHVICPTCQMKFTKRSTLLMHIKARDLYRMRSVNFDICFVFICQG